MLLKNTKIKSAILALFYLVFCCTKFVVFIVSDLSMLSAGIVFIVFVSAFDSFRFVGLLNWNTTAIANPVSNVKFTNSLKVLFFSFSIFYLLFFAIKIRHLADEFVVGVEGLKPPTLSV